MTDSAGAIAETTDYYPFGEMRIDNKAQNSTFTEQRKFIGQEYDTDTGLNYLNARYYNASVGRFTTQDPMFWNFNSDWLQDPQNQNAYAYARNNPIIYSDPSGKDPYAFSRPVDDYFPLNIVAHTGTLIVPRPGENLPPIYTNTQCIDTSKPFVLGGFPVGKPFLAWHLTMTVNDSKDYTIAMKQYNGENQKGTAMVKINQEGISPTQLDRNIVNTFNSTPTDQGYYNPIGGRRGTGFSNSNNTNTYLLEQSGVSQQVVNEIGNTLFYNNYRWAPGFGTSLTAPTYTQSVTQSVLSSLYSAVKTFTSVLQNYNSEHK